MFNSKIRKAIGITMWATCFFKFCPYRWDAKNYRFKRANTNHLILHNLVLAFEIIVTLFTFLRFFAMLGKSEPRPFIMAFIFSIARTMEMLCYIQFYVKRDEIMFFANAVFAYIDDTRRKKLKTQKSSEKKEKFVWDYTAVTLSLSSALVYINPPMHALLLVNTPCVPHFLSSIILDCKHHMDNSQPFSHKMPLILLENFLVMSMLQTITFNWTLIFIGSAWVKHILKEVRNDAVSANQTVRDMSRSKFRKAQTIIRHLNEAFQIYLATSPTLILAVLVLLIFSTIRFSEVDVTSYLMYPACTARCIFESYSLLAWAGHVNTASGEVLRKWKQSLRPSQSSYTYNKRFDKSCRKLTISAGSVYTFESSIILTNTHICSESTFNLLVVYK